MKEKIFVTCPKCNLVAIGEVVFEDETSLLILVKVSKIVFEKDNDEKIFLMEAGNRQDNFLVFWEINEKIKILLGNLGGVPHIHC